MKKNLYIANLLVAGLMTFTGCTDGFESDNANKAGYTPELQEYDLQKYVLNLGVIQLRLGKRYRLDFPDYTESGS